MLLMMMMMMVMVVSSSVSTVPVVRAGRPGVRFPVGVIHFVLRRNVHFGSVVRPVYLLKNTSDSFSGGEAERLRR